MPTDYLCIQNGEVVLPDRSVQAGTVIVREGRIVHAGETRKTPRRAEEIDAKSGYVTPGLIDVHIHGAGLVGWEACTEEGIEQVNKTLLANGITRFVPAMMADETVVSKVAWLLETVNWSRRVPGMYVEGPFINPAKKGGVQKKFIRPVNLPYLKKLQSIAAGQIKMMTFSPELKGAGKLPEAMKELGILPCLGHSDAESDQADMVCGRRKVNCTHLFNAMSGLDHKRPGLAAFGLNRDHVYVELNPDGTHVTAELLKLTIRTKPVDRIVLISDAVVSAGTSPGIYEYMNRKVRSSSEGVYYMEDGTLVGSSILLNQGVARFIRATGCPVYEAVRMATLNPAEMLGIGRRVGSLEEGKAADISIFTRDFSKTREVFLSGRSVDEI